ncbi:hypothetical protein D3C76_961260 [compost metagenome]
MFVINFKLNFKKIFLVLLIISAIVAIIIEFGYGNDSRSVASKSVDKYDYIFDDSNYTELLKTIHDNMEANINKTVKLTGYVFRMADFKDDYFVVGRNTIINGEDNIAGLLCQSKDANKLLDNEWVEITGVIIKGVYNGDMPVVKVGSIKKVSAPANTFVETKNVE